MPLPEFWDYLKPGTVFTGTDVLFDVDGYERSELFMSIYVRTAHDYPGFFPLIKSGLPPKTYVPDPKLEAALENLRRAIGKAGGA